MNVVEAKVQSLAQRVEVCPQAVQVVLAFLHAHDGKDETSVDAAMLCWRIHDYALYRFRQRAREQLHQWGISSTRKIGEIVIELIDANLAQSAGQISLSDFENIFDFDSQFVTRHFPSDFQFSRWTIAGLFVLTTIVALGLPGLKSRGITGALGAVMGGWVALIGAMCLIFGTRGAFRSKAIAAVIGIALLLCGVALFSFMSRMK